MNSKTQAWIVAARPRTLPLSVAGILTGTGFALRENLFDGLIFTLAILTTLGLQILSNFANEYGDAKKGTDNEDRLGPIRGIQAGIISMQEMKKAVILTGTLTFICAVTLIFVAFGLEEMFYVLLFIILGILAIIAAIKYTVGKTAYGYRGLGDLFVFLFFGLLSVAGSYFLYGKNLPNLIWILATVIGLLSIAVINLNNMRDIDNDRNSGKHTLVVKMGSTKAKIYHYALILVSLILTLIYILLEGKAVNWLMLLAFIPLLIHLRAVYLNSEPQKLDPELKKVALSTVFLALIYLWVGFF